MGFVWRLTFISLSSRVDIVSKNTVFELHMSTVNLIESWKELAKVMKSYRQSRFLTDFILISYMNRNQFKGLKEAPRSKLRSNLPINILA